MTVRAILKDGKEVVLDQARHGGTLDEMVASVTDNAVTGSAAPLATAKLTTTEGSEIEYADVNTFVEDTSFLP